MADLPLGPHNSTHTENLTIRDNNGATAEASTVANANVRVRRNRMKRQHSTNSIQIEQFENGKATTTPGPDNLVDGKLTDEDGKIWNDRQFKVTDGFLDPSSNYTGFVEVIGKLERDRETNCRYKNTYF